MLPFLSRRTRHFRTKVAKYLFDYLHNVMSSGITFFMSTCENLYNMKKEVILQILEKLPFLLEFKT